MDKFRLKIAEIVLCTMFIVWIIAMLCFGFMLFPLYIVNYYIAIIFGFLSWLVAIIYKIFFYRPKQNTGDVQYILLVILFSYVFIIFGGNFVFALLRISFKYMILWNTIAMAIFILGEMFATNYVAHTSDIVATYEARSYNHSKLSGQMSKLVAISEDKEVKSALLRLKQSFEYANPLSSRADSDVEMQMMSKIKDVEHMILSHTEPNTILEEIEGIIVDVKVRNTIKSI